MVYVVLQQDNFDRSSKLAMFYLRKVALSEAKDLRAAYERGEIGLEELREAAADPHANEQEDDQPADVPETTPTGRKGKGRATGPAAESQVATNYTGVRFCHAIPCALLMYSADYCERHFAPSSV